MTVLLGIDPGSRKTGFGIIRIDRNQPSYVTSGTIQLPVKEPLGARLKVLFESLSEIIATHQPTVAAIESVFMAKSADSALKLGHARGAAMVACVMNDLEVYEYAARQIKQSVVGTGAATKQQIQHMVTVLLGLSAEPAEDAADGLAAALCHCHTQGLAATLAARGFRAGRLR
ncbi:MAG: crossover junction endodeoxyribonuclease RuvC [Luminiphilus sp.]|jgi:crossover junction endodeoxyribonuclease RuvC|nr:crossover junction endodeoxyribonuclease RuvC [Luminiphilus sp.]